MLAHPAKMRRLCLRNLQLDPEQDSEREESSSSGIGQFEIREAATDAQSKPPEDLDADPNDPVLPVWEPDPDKAMEADVEYLTEVHLPPNQHSASALRKP